MEEMIMRKKITALVLSLTLAVGMAGCSKAEDKSMMEYTDTSANSVDYSVKEFYGYNSEEVKDIAIDSGQSFKYSAKCEMPDQNQTLNVDVQNIEWNTEEYKNIEENSWSAVSVSPFSTFAADVDTASYANLRRMIVQGSDIPADAVRIEELINYFNYDYAAPVNGDPFSVTTELAPCPWNENTELLMVGIKAKDIDMSQRKASNLVFLVDVSGSMAGAERLGLVQSSFKMLTEELGQNDRISLVTYASGSGVVFEGLSGADKKEITQKVEDLFAGGGTNGAEGIETAYEIAEKYFIEGGNNRIILATDGDLNIGITDEGSLTDLVKEKAKSGVFLSVLGFGWGNISDSRMEALADNGNGNYNYIDSINEAKKVLIDEMGGTLFTVAKDVKIQLEFNPANVKGYRLIGYENRTMAAEDFNDDKKDGGEIGAGHTVTALYEIALKDSAQEIPEVNSKYTVKTESGADNGLEKEYLTVNIRYKEPDGDTSTLISHAVDESAAAEKMSDDLSWAAGVAQAGMIIRNSEYKGTSTMNDVIERISKLQSVANDDYKKEFCSLMKNLKIE